MRPCIARDVLVAAGITLLVAAACNSTGGTYVPPEVPPPRAGAPAGTQTPADTGGPADGTGVPGSPQAAPNDDSAEVTLEIATTEDDPLAFTEETLSAPAGTVVAVRYLNDSSVPHNIAFFEGGDASAPRLAATEVGTGPDDLQTVTFTTPSRAGAYFFHCDVHPQQMTGTLEITD